MSTSDLPPLSTALERALSALRPRRGRRPWYALALVVSISLVIAALLLAGPSAWIFGRAIRRDLDGLPVWWVVAMAALWAIGFGLPLVRALVPRRGEVMPHVRGAIRAAVFSAAALLLATLLFSRQAEQSCSTHGPLHFWRVALECLASALVIALTPAVLGLVAIRRAVPIGARSVAGAVGASAGALGGLALHLHCHFADTAHVVISHAGAVVLAALLVAWMGPRILRP
jgi:hypothetical protein